MSSHRLYSGLPALPFHKAWAEIDTDALKRNYISLCDYAPASRRICVVKADAYGHTASLCVPALLDAGCDFFAVSCIDEALEVRALCKKAKKNADILVLGYTAPEHIKSLADNDIIQAVISEQHAESLCFGAKQYNCRIRVHIALDTGMNRIGLDARCEEECRCAAELIKTLYDKNELIVEGMFTHFSKADESPTESDGDKFTQGQYERFVSVNNILKNDNIRLFCHVSNSAATVRFPDLTLDGVRLGILLYGAAPSSHVSTEVSPVMSLHTFISRIHKLPAGQRVSYGGEFVSDTDKIIAALPIGYADGFQRSYRNCEVTVHTSSGDFKAPIIGRVCMDQCMIDVTNIPAAVGDKITVFGYDKSDLSRLAQMAETIEYEVLCLISGRVPRIVRGGSRE